MEEYQEVQDHAAALRTQKRKTALAVVISIVCTLLVTALITVSVTWMFARQTYRQEGGKLITSVKEAREILRNHFFYYQDDETALTEAILSLPKVGRTFLSNISI